MPSILWWKKDADPSSVPEDVQLRLRYRSPQASTPIQLQYREHYPYEASPLEYYIDREQKIFPHYDEADTIVAITNTIANKTAIAFHRTINQQRRMKRHRLDPWVETSLQSAARSPEELVLYMRTLAKELLRAGCRYRREQSFHHAVQNDAALLHVDCDLRTYMALHCAYRHDLPLYAAKSPFHMYACSEDHAFEMTALQQERKFLTTHDRQRKKDVDVSDEEAEMRKFYKPVVQYEHLCRSIDGNLLFEALDRVQSNVDATREDIQHVCSTADDMLQEFQDGFYIVKNARKAHLYAFKYYAGISDFSEEDRMRSQFHLKRARSIRKDHEQYYKY